MQVSQHRHIITNKNGFFVSSNNYINNTAKYAILNINGMNFIQVIYRSKILNFLLDTGASVSVIFLECIQGHENVDTSKSIKIKGIGGLTSALGTTNILFSIKNNDISYDFLVTKTFSAGIDGILGSDFFSKYKATINYESNLFSFKLHNKNINVPMLSKFETYMSLPPRSEIIKYCDITYASETDFVVIPEEICEGVFVAGLLVNPQKGQIAVRFLNVNEG